MVIDKAGVVLYHPSFVMLTTVNELHLAELVNQFVYSLTSSFHLKKRSVKRRTTMVAD